MQMKEAFVDTHDFLMEHYTMLDNGWMTKEIFFSFLVMFVCKIGLYPSFS